MKKFLFAIAFVLPSIMKGYDFQHGNYYFNRLELTKTENVGGVLTYHYNVEATSKEGGHSSFKQTYSGPICPPGTFNETDISGDQIITYVYTLTRIGEMAFANNASATEIVIPATVTNISRMGFLPNMELQSITCLAMTPPIHDDNSFLLFVEEITSTATLYVPNGTLSLYQNAPGWRAFNKIKELSPSIGNHEYIDLGLSSGKLWATTNYGSTSETDYGSYVDWSSYDVVTENWGSQWATPTSYELQELADECTWVWDSNKGGFVITGNNGNSMFLPAGGFKIRGYGQMVGKGIYYWSSTTGYGDGFVYMLSGSSTGVDTYSTYNTSIMSAPIRPIVQGLTNAVEDIITNEPPIYEGIYSLEGKKLPQINRGVNIVKMSDGKTRKVLVK